MRRQFHPILLDHMRRDERIWVATADLGYGMWNAIRAEFPNRWINVGVSEQLLLGVGVGLAEEGKIPVCSSITPFLLYRGAEWIRNYLEHEGAKVKLCAFGRDDDYHEDGFTHYAGDDRAFLSLFPRIRCFWPELDNLAEATQDWLYHDGPSYLNLRR